MLILFISNGSGLPVTEASHFLGLGIRLVVQVIEWLLQYTKAAMPQIELMQLLVDETVKERNLAA
jgi:hypothetical protein